MITDVELVCWVARAKEEAIARNASPALALVCHGETGLAFSAPIGISQLEPLTSTLGALDMIASIPVFKNPLVRPDTMILCERGGRGRLLAVLRVRELPSDSPPSHFNCPCKDPS